MIKKNPVSSYAMVFTFLGIAIPCIAQTVTPARLDDSDPNLKKCIQLVKNGDGKDVSDFVKQLTEKMGGIKKKNLAECDEESELGLDPKLKNASGDLMAAALTFLELQVYSPESLTDGPGPAATDDPFKTTLLPDPIPDFCRGTLTALKIDPNAFAKIIAELVENQKKPKAVKDENAKAREKDFKSFLKDHLQREVGPAEKVSGFEKLDAAEIAAVKGYTSQDYAELNMSLRDPDPSLAKEWNNYRDELNAALDKIPDYHGEVHRGTNLPSQVLDTYQVGSEVTSPAFTSASKVTGFKGNAKFIIYSLHGKYINPISTWNGEQEVLFKAGTKFKVIDRTSKVGETDLVMIEVP